MIMTMRCSSAVVAMMLAISTSAAAQEPTPKPAVPAEAAVPARARRPEPGARPAEVPRPAPVALVAPAVFTETLTELVSNQATFSEMRERFAGLTTTQGRAADWRLSGGDPADSLYRVAREQLNRGDYRKAIALFKDMLQQFPNSVYAAEVPYWQAFALYRIGGTGDLQDALQLLDQQRTKYPAARTQSDAAALAARIAGVLTSRGQGDKELVKRALSAGGTQCDREDLSVRAEALNALMQSEPDAAFAIAQKILARRDECAADLRRSVVFMLGNRKDEKSVQLMLQVARTEPNSEVRADAVSWVGRLPGDEALAVLEEIASKNDDERVQRAAVRALAAHPNVRARQATRALLERNDANERIRLAVVDAFSGERFTADDATWLRGIYPKVESPRVRSRILQVLSNLKGDDTQQWLLSIARNPAEPSEARSTALRGAGRSLDLPALGKFYDGVGDRSLREMVIDVLGERKENEATDKLIEIVRAGTDPNLRRSAISALTRKKDPRTTKLLLEIIDR